MRTAPADPAADPQADPVPVVDPAPQPDPPAPVADPAPEPAPIADPAAAPEPTPEPVPAAADWRDQRIKQLTARMREFERENQQLKSQGKDPAPAGAAATQEELDRLVDQRATERTAVNEFNRRCQEVVEKGREDFGGVEFDQRVQALVGLSNSGDPQDALRYNQLVVAALETGDAPRLLHELGGNLNEAMRLMQLSPMAMAVALTKMAAKPAGEVSNASRPIRPLTNQGGARQQIAPDDPERADQLSTAEWMRRREADVAAKAQQRR